MDAVLGYSGDVFCVIFSYLEGAIERT
jgi:hypothetical protein